MSNMVYNFHCEYAKTHSYVYKYANERARVAACMAGNVRKYPAGKAEKRCPVGANCGADSTQAADLLETLRLAWRRRIVGECVKRGGWPVMVETLAALVVCSRFVGCVDRLRKLAARCFACLQLIGVMCGKVCSSRLQVDSLTVCTFASVSVFGIGCKCWQMVCAFVAILPR